VPLDGERAVALYRASAAAGDTRAYVALGDLFAAGVAVPQDPAAALGWYEEAARQADGKAMFRLGEAYERGRGASADPSLALCWYTLAGQNGYEGAAERVERVGKGLDDAARQAAQERVGEACAEAALQ
jgi:TPR repeat protein